MKKNDPAVYATLLGERKRQREGMEMIASENYVSKAVLEALGSEFTNKYSEGYVGKRYYGGQEYTDAVEQLAIDRVKKLFGAEHANVQPLSGAPANLAVYSALCEPGDTILGMDLSHGGHLTHGHPVTLPAKIYNFIRYKTKKDGTIDYDELHKTAMKEKPKLILVGFSSYSREPKYKIFREIADDCGALLMLDMAHIAGLIAGKAVTNPVALFDVVTSTTHKTLRGPRGGLILCKAKHAKAIDKAVFPGMQGGPHMNNIAAKAIAFGEALKPQFRQYVKNVMKNAKTLEIELKKNGFTLVFGGKTENHLVLVDVVKSKGLTGKQVEVALDEIGITVNKNVIPDDPRGPMDPSGVRIGVPAITTRGMRTAEVKKIVRWMTEALENHDNPDALKAIHKDVIQLCKRFPVSH